MKVLVCGGRYFNKRQTLYSVLDLFKITYLINGGAPGADKLSSEWAVTRDIPFEEYPADWSKHGRAAGPKRNQEMIDFNPDLACAIAFTGGNGTKDMVRRLRVEGIRVIMIGWKTDESTL